MRVSVEPEIEDYAPVAYLSIIEALKSQNASLCFYRLRKKIKKKRKQYLKYPVLTEEIARQMDLLVVFSPYATSHKAKAWSDRHKVPMLHLEKGFLPKSVLCDVKGFWGEASITNHTTRLLNNCLSEKCIEWTRQYKKFLVSNNISKRKQPSDHPNIDKGFVFLPMQYMSDQSILRFGNLPYPRFVGKVAKFCAKNNVQLVVKKHPHAYRKEPKKVDAMLKKMKKRFGSRFIVADGSIHWFCQNCLFMAGMNTGSIIDGLLNGIVISHCGQSIFMNSGAVIHDDDVYAGLQRCLNISSRDKVHMQQRQNAMIYFLYHKYLLLEEDTHNSKLSNADKVRKQIESI